jgi:hypothetical protein
MANEDRMQTVAGALDQFRDRGYRQEMAIKAGRLQVDGTDRTYRPDEVVVRDYWRYEGVSDPGDESVVYAIETSDGVRGARWSTPTTRMPIHPSASSCGR